jgi:hypothetical protein
LERLGDALFAFVQGGELALRLLALGNVGVRADPLADRPSGSRTGTARREK